MARIFGSLGFGIVETDERLDLTVPTFRRDVEGKADLAEEIARIRGYDEIPTTLPTGAIPEALPEPYRYWERVAREAMIAAGLQEVITYSLVDCDTAARVTVDTGSGAASVPLDMLRLANPMTPEQACLRTTLVGSLMRTVASNLRHESRVFAFELGRVYLPPLNPLPEERRTLGIAITGPRQPEAWNSRTDDGDFFDVKGALERLLATMGIADALFRPGRHVSMHPGRTAELVVDGKVAGHLGEVHPIVVERYDMLPHRVYVAEIDFDQLMAAATADRRHVALPRFPAVSHDIAVVLAEDWSNQEVEEVIRKAGSPLLVEVRFFDLYRGPSIPEGAKSLAFALTYRAPDRTLTDEEVVAVEQKIVAALSTSFEASFRGR
jgi:phenylalanyl-tRNA synthetase beta chain